MKKGKSPIAYQLRTIYLRKKYLQSKHSNGEVLTRREVEELRISADEIRRFKILSTCLVPVGNIIIAPIYFNPRRFWPSLLWDNHNHIKYREQENLEKCVHQEKLSRYQSLHDALAQIKNFVDDPNRLNRSVQNSFATEGALALTNLSREHLECLAACHDLCSFSFLYRWSPRSSLTQWLLSRGRELIKDDELLIREKNIDGLTTTEVVDACLRRGILSKGVYATLVLKTGIESDDDDATDESMKAKDDNIPELIEKNWDIDLLKKRLKQWVEVVSIMKNIKRDNFTSFYLHASALGLLVKGSE